MQVYGVIGNPVSHSRSPALHNAAMRAAGLDAVYVPLLVDELLPFLAAFPDFSGFSVTIPHKVAGPRLALCPFMVALLLIDHIHAMICTTAQFMCCRAPNSLSVN